MQLGTVVYGTVVAITMASHGGEHAWDIDDEQAHQALYVRWQLKMWSYWHDPTWKKDEQSTNGFAFSYSGSIFPQSFTVSSSASLNYRCYSSIDESSRLCDGVSSTGLFLS